MLMDKVTQKINSLKLREFYFEHLEYLKLFWSKGKKVICDSKGLVTAITGNIIYASSSPQKIIASFKSIRVK